MTSPDLLFTETVRFVSHSATCTYLQTGICIGLSWVSTKRPAFLRASTTATLAWNRFMPWKITSKPVHLAKNRVADLKFLPGIGIKGPIVIENVYEGKLVANSNFVVIPVMSGGNLDSSGAEFHVNDDRVFYNRESAIDKRVDSKFSVKML